MNGPGNAFSFPTASRRISSRDDLGARSAAGADGSGDHHHHHHPRERELSSSSSLNGGQSYPLTNGHHSTSSTASSHHAHPNGIAEPRSFSSILSPALSSTGGQHDQQDPLAKPFVYSREFLLSLYDEDKASRRPIELARHDIATKDIGGKPWALNEWRAGEKELFSNSIHPPTSTRSNNRSSQSQTPSQSNTNGTLDLSSLPSLPRERDRALANSTPSSARAPSGSLSAGIASADKDGTGPLSSSARRARGVAPLGSGSGGGIMGGVLGGLAQPARARPASPSAPLDRKKEDSPKALTGERGAPAKEVWQGGRWRRGGATETEEEKRPSAFGARRYPTAEGGDPDGAPATQTATPPDSAIADSRSDVPTSWDDDEDSDDKPSSASLPSESTQSVSANQPKSSAQQERDVDYLSEPDLAHHATSILGSLSLDAADDPLLGPTRSSTLPPGLPSAALPSEPPLHTLSWHYRDPSGQLQGPFTASMMHDWYSQKFFTGDLLVKRTHERDFEPLDSLVRRARDAETPFLTAPLQPVAAPPPPAPSSVWPGMSAASPLDQYAAGSNRGNAFGSFYEPFGNGQPASNLFDPHRQASPFGGFGTPERRTASGNGMLDPWGAPLPSGVPTHEASTRSFASPGWNAFGTAGAAQSPFPGSPQLPQHFPPQPQADPFASAQHPASGPNTDVFGRAQPVASPFFDPNQLNSSATPDWTRLNGLPAASPQQQPQNVHQHQLPQQQQQHTPQMQPQGWASLIPSSASRLADLPASMPSPIGPPAAFGSAQQQQPHSAWGLPQKAPEPQTPQHASPQFAAAPAQNLVLAPVVAEPTASLKSGSIEQSAATKVSSPIAAAPAPVQAPSSAPQPTAVSPSANALPATPAAAPQPAIASTPVPSAPSTPSAAPKAPIVAPWVKDEESSGPASPSLREIQQAEAKQAELRKTAERQAAARQQALAAVQAAQQAAAAEAESLPSSSTWASSPSASPAPKTPGGGAVTPTAAGAPTAPWLAKTKTPVQGKTLKEIQEEEERRKKAVAAAAAQVAAPAGVRGYAGSIGQNAAKTAGASWTTIAVKPAAVPVAPVGRSIIPGGPIVAPRGAAALPAKPPAPISTPTARAVVASQPARPVSRTNGAVKYDAENPPPPSTEFMKWCKDALKGLTVPMDEFIQMLLSFPLDASADVLEIISDSVYANSSTLDGRRFANDFSSRRKIDVQARYPQIVVKTAGAAGGTKGVPGKPSSMADAVKAAQVAQPQEWQVRVSGAGGKKKKGTK